MRAKQIINMKLLLPFLAVSQAQFNLQGPYSNWDQYESRIHFQYNGGMYAMVGDLLTDFGYPATFLDLWATATDDSIMGAIASVIYLFFNLFRYKHII